MEDTAAAAREYRKLALELSEKAALMDDPDNRTVMLSAASVYESLAGMIENTPADGVAAPTVPKNNTFLKT